MTMIDLSRTQKELSESVQYAVKWFEKNGFDGQLTRNNTAKTEFVVSKDGVSDTFTLTATRQDPRKCDIKRYMAEFEKSFTMKCEIEALRKQLHS